MAIPRPPDCDDERDATTHGRDRRERGVHGHLRRGVDEAHAVGPDEPHAVPTGERDQFAFCDRTVAAGLGKAGTDHHEPAHASLAAGLDDSGDQRSGYGDHREVDRSGQGGHRGVSGEAGDLTPCRVDGIEIASETTVDQVRQQLPADGAGSPARADDGDRGRPQQPIDRGDVRLAVALLDRIEIGLGCLELHRHPDDAGFVRRMLLEAGLSKHVEHAVVLGEGVGHEPGDPGSYGRRSQVFEQDRADTSPLVVVADGEGHLGLLATCARS